MHIRTLGSLEIQGTLRTVTVAGKDAIFLAELLTHRDAVVDAAHLAEQLWPENRPRDPANAVQVRASRLRALFREAAGDSGGAMLRTRSGGYLLATAGLSIDSTRYRDAVDDSFARLAAGDRPAAEAAWTAAERLWAGEPFPDLPRTFCLETEVERLIEERLSALERHSAAELDAGHAAAVATALGPHLRQHPFRERLHELAIRALFQSGRRVEALVAYARLRSVLLAELGTEPGPPLRALHAELLREELAESGVDPAPPAATAGRRPAVPSQLLGASGYFVGRDRERAGIHAALAGAPPGTARIVGVTGMAGVGKSALVTQLAHEIRGDFPDGQLYLNLHAGTAGISPMSSADAVIALLDGCGIAADRIPADPAAASALLRTVLAPTRTLIVLDDVVSAAHVRSLLPAGPGCTVLITSRASLSSLDCLLHLRLGPLSDGDSRSLAALASGRDRSEFDSPAGRSLVDLCGRLPLALRIVAARLATQSGLTVATLATRLTGHDRRLGYLEADDLSVRRSFEGAFEALTQSALAVDHDAAAALCRIGALDLPTYTPQTMAELLDTDEHRAAEALERLVAVALLEESGDDRYAPHDLVRDFARTLAGHPDRSAESRQAARRATRWYLGVAGQAALLLADSEPARAAVGRCVGDAGLGDRRFADAADALAWGARETPALLALTDQLRDPAKDLDHLVCLPCLLAPVLRRTGRIRELLSACDAALDAARRTADAFAEATLLQESAAALFDARRLEEALDRQRRAAEIWRRLDDSRFGPGAVVNVILLLAALDRDEEAIALIEQTLPEAVRDGDAFRESLLLSHLGYLTAKKDPAGAIVWHERSMAAGRRAGSPLMIVGGLGNIAKAYLAADDPARALEAVTAALAEDDRGPWNIERDNRLTLSRALQALHRPDAAAQACGELLTLAQHRDDAFGQGLAHHQSGLLMAEAGDTEAAVGRWRLAERQLQGLQTEVLGEVRRLLGEASIHVGGGTPGVTGSVTDSVTGSVTSPASRSR